MERLYGNSFKKGFESDRGRVYLQYGAPTNIITRETSPQEYPYEIWQYNKIKQFSNKRFIFFNPNLVGNFFTLLHSNMVGELKNPNWQFELNQRNTPNNTDNPSGNVQDSYGKQSEELFRQY